MSLLLQNAKKIFCMCDIYYTIMPLSFLISKFALAYQNVFFLFFYDVLLF